MEKGNTDKEEDCLQHTHEQSQPYDKNVYYINKEAMLSRLFKFELQDMFENVEYEEGNILQQGMESKPFEIPYTFCFQSLNVF